MSKLYSVCLKTEAYVTIEVEADSEDEAINEALEPLESVDDLIRLWAHEALRLFSDRLVYDYKKALN